MFCSTDELRAKLHSHVVVVSYRKEEPIKAKEFTKSTGSTVYISGQ